MVKDFSIKGASTMVLGNRSYAGNGKKFDVSDELRGIIQLIRKYPPLDKGTEYDLIRKFQNGDIESGQTVILHNQSIIYQLAKDFAKDEEEVRDFVMEGNIGMYEALYRFDLNKDFKFYTYARWWIMAAMTKYVSGDYQMVRIPDYSGSVRCAKRMSRIFFAKEGRNPTPEELKEIVESVKSETTGKKKYNVPYVESMYDIVFMSSETPVGDDNDYLVQDTIEYVNKTMSENNFIITEEDEYNKAILMPLLNYLDEGDRELIKKIYQIGKYNDLSKVRICEEYGLTEQQLNKMEAKLIKKMKQAYFKLGKRKLVV